MCRIGYGLDDMCMCEILSIQDRMHCAVLGALMKMFDNTRPGDGPGAPDTAHGLASLGSK